MQKFIEKLKSIDKGTLIRTASFLVTLLNDVAVMIAAFVGKAHPVYIALSLVATGITSAIAWWKNNDFTKAAQFGSGLMHAYKDGRITEEEAEDIRKQVEGEVHDDGE